MQTGPFPIMVSIRPFLYLMQNHMPLTVQPESSKSLIILLSLMSCILLFSSLGTWLTGRYQIVKLDDLKDRYWEPVKDFGATFANASAQPQVLEKELLESCKQSQVGTWLQTTDALMFVDPIAGNRVLVRLDPGRSFIELNGKDISACVQDEIESRQFDISAQTSSWAVLLMVMGIFSAGWAIFLIWLGYTRKRSPKTEIVTDVTADPVTTDVKD